jgi:hypothetical protein
MTCSGGVLDSLACADQGALCEDGADPSTATCVPCQGNAQCAGDEVVSCGATGIDVVDCAGLDATCFQPASGSDAQCKSCDRSGFEVYYWGPYFDDDVYRYMRVELIDAALTEVIFVESFPLFGGIAGTGTYVIQPTDTAGSPTRVYAATFSPAGDLLNLYFARAGALEITEAPTVAGDPIGFELRGIELVQVDLSWNEIPGGELWCLSQFAIAGPSQRFPCSFYGQDFTNTETACYGGRLIQCVDDAGGFGRVNLVADCAATGQFCIDTSSGGTQSAACQ